MVWELWSFGVLKGCIVAIVVIEGSGVLEVWGFGLLRFWSFVVLEFCSCEVLKLWVLETGLGVKGLRPDVAMRIG